MSDPTGTCTAPEDQDAGFDAHTTVLDDAFGPWHARIAPELSGFGGASGGYVAAIALRAMTSLVQDPERTPRSLTLRLLAPIHPGGIELVPTVDRAGSSMSALSLRIDQDGTTTADAVSQLGRTADSLEHLELAPPDVPTPEDCSPIRHKPAPDARAGFLVEHRPAAPPLPLSGGDRAQILVWMRLVEDHPLDVFVATMLADAAPPALFARLSELVPIPTAELTIHYGDLRALEHSPWLLGSFRTALAADGYAVEDGELWTPSGRLALQSRQLRRILAKPHHLDYGVI